MELEYNTQADKDVSMADRHQIYELWMKCFGYAPDWSDIGGESVMSVRYKNGQRQIVAVCTTYVRGGPCPHKHYERTESDSESESESESEYRGKCSVYQECKDNPVELKVQNFCAFPMKNGYGRGLINYVKDVAIHSDAMAVTLEVNIEDVGQTTFYQKQGFVKQGWPYPGQIDFEMRYQIREPVFPVRKIFPKPVKQPREWCPTQGLTNGFQAKQVEEINVNVDMMTTVVSNCIWESCILAPRDAADVLEAGMNWMGVDIEVINRVKACMTMAVFGRLIDKITAIGRKDYIELQHGNQYIFAVWDHPSIVRLCYGHINHWVFSTDNTKFKEFISTVTTCH